jgi:hypothetical protein
MGWMYVMLAGAATALPAYWMWTLCQDRVGKMTDRDLPRWNRARPALLAALAGASAVARIPESEAPREQS